ncbi:hypothetical protein COCON_G00115840 [Conger conger]|uniref:Uncharacterized protein n=1 Tax=Conger conger TaxID=82655 RepID=A0A9Q1HYA1_CONCO|nr:hypothetical protein COCON_G00115840 [Conger conger]
MAFNKTVIKPAAVQSSGSRQSPHSRLTVCNETEQRGGGPGGRRPACSAVNEASHEARRRATSPLLPPSVITCHSVHSAPCGRGGVLVYMTCGKEAERNSATPVGSRRPLGDMTSQGSDCPSEDSDSDDVSQTVSQFSESESDNSDSDSGSESQPGARPSRSASKQACKFYNKGYCKDGRKCKYLHVCQNFLKGKCRYNSQCDLSHTTNSGSESSADESQSRGRRSRRRRSSAGEDEDTDGMSYCWQINCGNGWKNIANDHIIEAQYSQPSSSGIKLYNTPFGSISIDFKKMKVLKKTGIRVRRWNSSRPGLETEWLWYCSNKHDWVQYGEKNSKGKAAPVQSSRIEKKFQKNQRGSLKFTIDTTDYRINFRGMCQENSASGRKRDVVRRPRFKMPQNRGSNRMPPQQRQGGSPVTWEFEGDGGRWYIFKHRSGTNTEASITSAHIEAQFQRNERGSMNFTVSGQRYVLDFSDICTFCFFHRYDSDESELTEETQVVILNHGCQTPVLEGCSVCSIGRLFSSYFVSSEMSGVYAVGSQVQGILNDNHSQPTAGSRHQYLWQLNDGQQWMNINNDHVIEAHYCQPGARGIKIFTANYGRIFIDFDKMEVQGSQLYVRRQIYLAQDEMEEMGWYYNDNRQWYEYGSQGSSSRTASVSSSDLEQQYSSHQSDISFTVGKFSYSLDIHAMTQTNMTTGIIRRVRRRPKLNSVIKLNSPAGASQVPQGQQSASHIGAGWKWQFQADEGIWTDYSSPRCSVDSDKIERWYQRNPQGQMAFNSRKFAYTLDFTGMLQTNSRTGTQRSVRRVQADGQPAHQRFVSPSSHQAPPQAMALPLPPSAGYTWEFMGEEGMWTEYKTPNCTMDSLKIERIYQSNPQGQAKFTAGRYTYTLDFAGMCQTNDAFGTQRAVRRLQQNSPQLNGNAEAGGVTPVLGFVSPSSHQAPPQAMALPLPPSAGYTWEFMGDEGMWTEYKTPNCTMDSLKIERIYQSNPQGQAKFTAGRYTYTLDFAGMCQTNDAFGTQRAVRRLQQNSPQLNGNAEAGGVTPVLGSAGAQHRWQYMDVDGAWKDFVKDRCSVSSDDIENSYQQNPGGTLSFATNSFQYQLNFSTMTQTNQSTQIVRNVRRL